MACEKGQSATTGYNYLSLTLRANRSSCVQIGESVQISLTASNTGQEVIVHESPTLPVLDIGVRSSLSQALDTSWSTQNPDKVLHRVEWKPGETKTLELVWTVPPANYAPGHRIAIDGFLSEGSEVITSSGVELCVGIPLEPK